MTEEFENEEFECERCYCQEADVYYADEDVDGTYYCWVCEDCAANMDSDKFYEEAS